MKKSFIINSTLLFLSLISIKIESINLQEHEVWWTHHPEIFDGWLKDANAESRVKVRKHISDKKYTNVLDIPCGHCTEFFGYKNDKIDIEYFGMDITQFLVDRATENGLNVERGSIEEIPYNDSTFDVTYSRHILEHLKYYKKAVSELIRVAKKEVAIIFFIKPHNKKDAINRQYYNGHILYHNRYDRRKLENYIRSHDKVEKIEWQNINRKENVLYISLKDQ